MLFIVSIAVVVFVSVVVVTVVAVAVAVVEVGVVVTLPADMIWCSVALLYFGLHSQEVVAPMIQLYFRRRLVRAKAKKAAVAACGGIFMSRRPTPSPPPQPTRGSASQRLGRHKQQTSGITSMQEVAFRAAERVSSVRFGGMCQGGGWGGGRGDGVCFFFVFLSFCKIGVSLCIRCRYIYSNLVPCKFISEVRFQLVNGLTNYSDVKSDYHGRVNQACSRVGSNLAGRVKANPT